MLAHLKTYHIRDRVGKLCRQELDPWVWSHLGIQWMLRGEDLPQT